jgi:PPOX class probable F420-dependent enzyme
MTRLPLELRELIETGALAHLSTIDPDGSPQVTVIWLGLDGDQLVSGHLSRNRKVQNIEQDPRVVLSFIDTRQNRTFYNPYAVLHAHAAVDPSDEAWDLLSRLASVYLPSSTEFPEARRPGYVVRYTVERIGGIGPWVQNA